MKSTGAANINVSGAGAITVMGDPELTGAQMSEWFASRGARYRLMGGMTITDLADLYVEEGAAEHVRPELAFAQAIIETGSFGNAIDNNFAGIGACDSCGNGFQFSSALSGVRAQIQLLRNYSDINSRVTNIPDPPVPELWGSNPSTASYNFDHYFAKGDAPLWNNMGNGNWATAPDYSTVVLKVYNQMLTFSGLPGQCPADGLTFGALTDAGPCPVGLRQPGREIAVRRRSLEADHGLGQHRRHGKAVLVLIRGERAAGVADRLGAVVSVTVTFPNP